MFNNQKLIAEGAKVAVGGYISKKMHLLEAAAGLNNPDQMPLWQWQLLLERLLGMETAFRSLTLSAIDGRPLVFVHRYAPSHADARANDLRDVHYFPINGTPSFISEIHIDPQTSEP